MFSLRSRSFLPFQRTISFHFLTADFGFQLPEPSQNQEKIPDGDLYPDSPHSNTPLLQNVETHAPDPFIIAKSRQLNKRVTLNVGGTRHEVMWKMLESKCVPVILYLLNTTI